MKKQIAFVLVGAGAAALVALAQNQPSKDKPAHKEPAAPAAKDGAAPDHAAMEQAWMALGQKNEHHARIAKMAGTFDCEVKHYMEPGAPPMVSKGTSVQTLIHDGRFLHQEFKSDMMGQPFTGSGDWGYDNATQKYVGSWCDSMSTGIMMMTGTYDDATKTYTSTGHMNGPGGTKCLMREVSHTISDDQFTFEMYMTMPGMPEIKAMEITYTRKK